jgi:glutamate decarboxylase
VANGLAAMGPLRLVSHPKGQLPVFAVELDPSIVNYNVFHLADKLRERGWLIPAYTLPPHCEDRTVLRIVIRADFSSELADILLEDFERALTHFGALDGPMPLSEPTRRFAHL